MNRFVFLLAVLCLLLLSACASLDMSHMQTAIPLGANHVDASVYLGSGINLNSTQEFSEIYDEIAATDTLNCSLDINNQSQWIEWGKIITTVNGGLNLAYGLGPKTDIFFRSIGDWGCKLGVKQLLWNQEDSFIAIMPVVNYANMKFTGRESYQGETVFEADDRYLIYGAELHGIYTHKPNKITSLTVSPHISMTIFSRQYNGTDYGPYHVFHGGIKSNAKVNFLHLFLIGEFGLEALDTYRHGIIAVPNYALALGINL